MRNAALVLTLRSKELKPNWLRDAALALPCASRHAHILWAKKTPYSIPTDGGIATRVPNCSKIELQSWSSITHPA